MSWAMLAVVSIVAYSSMLFVLKSRQLRTSLAISSETVNGALQASDWALALGHLNSLEKTGHVFGITLKGRGAALSGPFGTEPFGFGRLCVEQPVNAQYQLTGCMRVLAGTEIYTLLFFIGFSGAFFLAALLFFERNLLLFVEQVAHDVRSPLAALEAALDDVAQLPEDKRLLIRSAVGRIRDIANDLLARQRPSAGSVIGQASSASHLLSGLIGPVVTEKRLQFRARHDVEIEAELDASYGLFAQVQPAEFKRVLSNLVNNAVEALEARSGRVEVGLSFADGEVTVHVRDDGKGIDPKTLAKLGARGGSHGKTGGSGLGLHHARACAQAWGGRLEFASELGRGTTVSLILPQAEAPDWFVSELSVSKGTRVIVLDDDPSIHRIWQGRLDAAKAKERGIEFRAFSSADQLRDWVRSKPADAVRAFFLLDYELTGQRATGLSLIEELGISARAVLVTSRHEESQVLAGCRRLNVRMIPKALARLVPLRIVEDDLPAGKWDAVLIDDDPLVRRTWEIAAARIGRRLKTYPSAGEFLAASALFEPGVPIYIDAQLGNGERGEDQSKVICDLGFREIYLATGDAAEKFRGMSHLRGVIGKSPPWGVA